MYFLPCGFILHRAELFLCFQWSLMGGPMLHSPSIGLRILAFSISVCFCVGLCIVGASASVAMSAVAFASTGASSFCMHLRVHVIVFMSASASAIPGCNLCAILFLLVETYWFYGILDII